MRKQPVAERRIAVVSETMTININSKDPAVRREISRDSQRFKEITDLSKRLEAL